MQNGVTNGEFERALAALQSEMRAGFQGVNARLDRVNGRLDKTEDGLNEVRPIVAEQNVKIATLNREVFRDGRERRVVSRQDDGDQGRVVISLPTDAKTLVMLFLTAGALIAAAVIAWLKGQGS